MPNLCLAHHLVSKVEKTGRLRLTSLTVVHMPGDELSARRPHAHCVVLARVHRASGWGELHRDLVANDAQAAFDSEWSAFRDEWAPRLAPG